MPVQKYASSMYLKYFKFKGLGFFVLFLDAGKNCYHLQLC